MDTATKTGIDSKRVVQKTAEVTADLIESIQFYWT